MERKPEGERSDQVHRKPADQVVLKLNAERVRDDHYSEERNAGSEDQAVKNNDERGLLEVGKLGSFNFTVHLGHGFLAAHGEDGMPEADQNSDKADGVNP